jgi:hypothetical protein
MSALAIALVLISDLFHALRSFFTKESDDKQIFLWLYSIFALLFFSVLSISCCGATPFVVVYKLPMR